MRQALFILMVVLLTSCSVISPPKFNETEYRTIAEIATVLDLGACDRDIIAKLVVSSAFLEHYTKHLPNNEKTWESAVLFRQQIKELASKTTISETYCQLKLEVMRQTVDALQHGAGGK